MPNNFWFHRYGYTDFHEMDLDWILTEIKDLRATVDEFTTLVNTFDSRITALEGQATSLTNRVGALESNFGQLAEDVEHAESMINLNRAGITRLTNNDIQDARMVSDVPAVYAGANDITLEFPIDIYSDGSKTDTSDTIELHPATESACGLLAPTDKAKLSKMTLDGNNISFAGKVQSANAPSSGTDLVNKTYVDSLAISGSATVGTDESIYNGTPTTNMTDTTVSMGGVAHTYGKITMLNLTGSLSFALHATDVIDNKTVICSGYIKSGLRPRNGSYFNGVANYKLSDVAGAPQYYAPLAIVFGQAGFFRIIYTGETLNNYPNSFQMHACLTFIDIDQA